MVIVDEKAMLPPPPPYLQAPLRTAPVPLHPPPFSDHARHMATIRDLSPYILLQIVYHAFPQTPDVDRGRLERQRKTLYWMSTALRLVNRSFYIACMHVLRSTYLPSYTALIRAPYTSDPFPLTSHPSPSSSAPSPPLLPSLQRETAVLDLFIALKVREDVWADDSDLHLASDESWRDLFDLMQPRARAEDLVRVYGERYGAIAPAGAAGSRKVDFAAVSVAFSPRRVGVALGTAGSRRRTVVEVDRTRDEKLEVAAKRLAKALAGWLATGR